MGKEVEGIDDEVHEQIACRDGGRWGGLDLIIPLL